MAGNFVVRARIDERTKMEEAAALKKIGLKLSPNAETVAAMKAARRGELVKVGRPDKLLQSLNT